MHDAQGGTGTKGRENIRAEKAEHIRRNARTADTPNLRPPGRIRLLGSEGTSDRTPLDGQVLSAGSRPLADSETNDFATHSPLCAARKAKPQKGNWSLPNFRQVQVLDPPSREGREVWAEWRHALRREPNIDSTKCVKPDSRARLTAESHLALRR